MLDAIFYSQNGKACSFEQEGVALEILNRVKGIVNNGISLRFLQRLPHITLLNVEYYRSEMMPVLAEWCFLWLQKQHLHGIDRLEAIRYIIEGAATKSESSTKLNFIERAIKKTKSALGQDPISPTFTSGYRRSMSFEEHEEKLSEITSLQRKTSESVQADPEQYNLLREELTELEEAYAIAQINQSLINEIYDFDEKINNERTAQSSVITEIQSEIFKLNKKIQELECPRDTSLDNCVVVWCSQAFAPLGVGAAGVGSNANTGVTAQSESSVAAVCNQLEEMGLTVRRCYETDEAIARSRDLQNEKQLRCLIIGGDESKPGCGPDCREQHSGDGNCLRCGKGWGNHSGHNCMNPRHSGTRGSWIKEGSSALADNKIKSLETIKTLTDTKSRHAKLYSALPAERIAVYAAQSTVKEDIRMSLWTIGAKVMDDPKSLVKWVKEFRPWDTAHSAPVFSEDSTLSPEFQELLDEAQELLNSFDKNNDSVAPEDGVRETLLSLREQVEALESKKANLNTDDEHARKSMQLEAAERHKKLESSIIERISVLEISGRKLNELLTKIDTSLDDVRQSFPGPHSGRDAAIALAWISKYGESVLSAGVVDTKTAAQIKRCHQHISNEIQFLRQTLLAAKVVTHVTSPNHKKILNLCHNWLITYLPHCLAKINRVSFGLLTAEDCKAALDADPNVPRSRLKLAVP